MAQLSTIISSILRDMVYAQHQANMYAISLEDIYRKNGRLEQFAMPAIALGEMELNIKYGITEADKEVEQLEINYPALRKNIRYICKAGAELLIRVALPILKNALNRNPNVGDDFVDGLEGNASLKRDLNAFLGHKIFHTIQNDPYSINNDDGTFNEVAIVKVYVYVCEEYLLHHEDFEEIISNYLDEKIFNRVVNAVKTAAEQEVPAILADMNIKHKRIIPSVDVVVGTEELSKLPEEAIHTLHFKVSPQSINLYTKD